MLFCEAPLLGAVLFVPVTRHQEVVPAPVNQYKLHVCFLVWATGLIVSPTCCHHGKDKERYYSVLKPRKNPFSSFDNTFFLVLLWGLYFA